MKNVMIALSMILAAAANASEIKIAQYSQYELWGNPYVTQAFAYNSDMGRAWVEVKITSNDPDGGVGSTDRVKVEGLSYNPESREIVIDHEGKLTTCATVKTTGRGIFKQTHIKESKACKFVGRWKEITYDDGFEIKKTSRYELFLNVE